MAMDELEVSKIFGAGCAALLAFVGFGQLGSAVVGVDQLDEPAYVIEIADAEDAGAVEEEAMPIGQLMAMAVMDDGPKVFKKCSACHKVEEGGSNGVGPNLYGIVGRDIGGVDGYAYSNVLAENGGVWDFAALDGFLEAPKKWAPGTKMGFAGLSKPKDRASVIAWLNEQSASPLPMPAMEASEVEDATETQMAAVEPESAEVDEVAEAEKAAEAAQAAEAEKAAEAAKAAEAERVAKAEAEKAAQAEQAAAAEAAKAAEAEKAAAEKPAQTQMADASAAVAGAAAFMVGADAEKGAKVFRKCKACHKVDASAGNGVGPNLYGIVGREIAAVDGFKYSDALSGKGGAWTFEALNGFLTKPKEWAPGTKMAFPGLRKEADRAAVIAWLNAQSDSPLPMPE